MLNLFKQEMMKFYLLSIHLLMFIIASAQNNPGLFGKKVAIGYNRQFSLINAAIGKESGMSTMKYLTNHDIYFERTTSKHKSISGHISFQKVPVSYFLMLSQNGQITDEIEINGKKTTVWGDKAGYSDFRYISFGIKYNIYVSNMSISAPSGMSSYIRFDVHTIKPINNHYYYDLGGANNIDLETVNQKIDRSVDNTSSINYSLGIGADNKFMLSRTLFLRLNAEFNLSSVGITQMVQEAFFVKENTVKRDLKFTGQSTNRFRNMFLFGFGLGKLF